MSRQTKIEWCDVTWNPITGCSPVSAGCTNCYAKNISKRFGFPWGKPVFQKHKLEEPLHIRKPSLIFVCSMSDVFHAEVEPSWFQQIMKIIAACPQHTFIMLTKRPENILRFLPGNIPDNVWLGVTAESQLQLLLRWPILRDIPAQVRFVSAEPLLSPVFIPKGIPRNDLPDWIICGPETGTAKRFCKDSWIGTLSLICRVMKIPFFDKRKTGWTRREWPINAVGNSPLLGTGGQHEDR